MPCDRDPYDPFDEEIDLEPLPLWVYEEDDSPWKLRNVRPHV